MQISVVRPSELGPSEIAAWHSIQRKAEVLANPFLCPEFAVAVDIVRPDARVAVLADGTEIVGFFPFQRGRFGVGKPIGGGLNDRQGLICMPDTECSLEELLRACKLSVWKFDHLVRDQRLFERYATVVASSPVIDLIDGFAPYLEKLRVTSPTFCKQVIRRAGKLEREAGQIRFVANSRDLTALRTLMVWKSDQYHRNQWIDLFAQPWIVKLVDVLLNTHTDWFGGMLALTYAGEELVAASFDLRCNDLLVSWFPTYNIKFRRQSPGLIHFLRMAEDAATRDIHLIDLGKGAELHKQHLKSHDVFLSEGMVAGAKLVAATHRVGDAAVKRAGPWIRQHPRFFQITEQLLRRYGRIR